MIPDLQGEPELFARFQEISTKFDEFILTKELRQITNGFRFLPKNTH